MQDTKKIILPCHPKIAYDMFQPKWQSPALFGQRRNAATTFRLLARPTRTRTIPENHPLIFSCRLHLNMFLCIETHLASVNTRIPNV